MEKMATELLADRVLIEERIAALTLEMRHCSDIQIIGNYNDNQTQIDSMLTGMRELLDSSANLSHDNLALHYTGMLIVYIYSLRILYPFIMILARL